MVSKELASLERETCKLKHINTLEKKSLYKHLQTNLNVTPAPVVPTDWGAGLVSELCCPTLPHVEALATWGLWGDGKCGGGCVL